MAPVKTMTSLKLSSNHTKEAIPTPLDTADGVKTPVILPFTAQD